METINFTCKEKLKSLLDKSCCQTIRKAWNIIEENKNCPDCGVTCETCLDCHQREEVIGQMIPKPAKFKVGDKAELVWNEKSEYFTFCQNCTGGIHPRAIEHSCAGSAESFTLDKIETFGKYLGVVEITEVFKIKAGKSLGSYCFFEDIFSERNLNLTEFSLLDGFKSADEMFKYFDK